MISINRIFTLVLCLGIYLMLFFRPLLSGMVYQYYNYIFLTYLICLIYLTVIRSVLSNQVLYFPKALTSVLMFFVFWSIYVSYVGHNWLSSIEVLVNIGSYFIIYWLVLNVMREKWQVSGVLISIISSAVLVSLFALFQKYWGLDETRQFYEIYQNTFNYTEGFKSRLYSNRVFSTFIYPNALAGYLLIVIPISFFVFFSRQILKSHRIIFYSVTLLSAFIFVLFQTHWIVLMWMVVGIIFYPILLVLALLWTLSKSTMILFSLMRWGVYLFFIPKWLKNKREKYLVYGFIFFEISLIFLSWYFFSDQIHKGISSFSSRLDYWASAFTMFLDHPMWGVGLGGFGANFSQYIFPGGEESQYVHNNFFQMFCETGTIGGILYILIWVYLGTRLIRRENIGAFQWLQIWVWFGSMIHHMVDFDWYVPGINWTLMALLAIDLDVPSKSWTISLRFKQRSSQVLYMIVLFLFCLFSVLWLKPLTQAAYFDKKGHDAFNTRQVEKAQEYFKQSLSQIPFNPELWFLLGQIHWNQHKIDLAREFFLNCLIYYPNSSMSYLYLSRIEEIKNQKLMAEQYLQKAIEKYPHNPIYHRELGLFYQRHSMPDKAKLSWQKYLELSESD